MKRILCIDPGYSLVKAMELFRQGDYAGHCLYGVNHLSKKIEVKLEPQKNVTGRFKAELMHLFNYLKIKPDVIYLTFCDYGVLLLLLRKLRIIKKPIVALFHGYLEDYSYRENWRDKLKIIIVNYLRKLELAAADYPVFINKYAYDMAHSKRKQYIPLMPEILKNGEQTNNGGGLNGEKRGYIISVGKTLRDYGPLFQAAKTHTDLKLRVVTNNISDFSGIKNVEVVNKIVSYRDVLRMYQEAFAICIPAIETGGGVYGLSSLLDALSACKPIIASNTIGLGIDVDGLKIGRTYKCGDADEFYEAFIYVEKHYKEMQNNIRKLTIGFNADVFGEKISEILLKA